MKTITLEEQFHAWLLGTYNDPEFNSNLHCFKVRKSVALVPGEVVDFVSVKHELTPSPEGHEVYSVALWSFTPDAIDIHSVNAMCRHLQAFRTWHASGVSRLEVAGQKSKILVGFNGNLVGSSVRTSSVIQLLSSGIGELAFWTFRRGVNRVEIEPYYDESPANGRPNPLLRDLFKHRLSEPSRADRSKSGRRSKVHSAV